MRQVERRTIMMMVIILLLSSPERLWSQKKTTEINWDEWGVPHIMAPNEREAFYASGWAQMKMHGNKILKLYGQARGEAASYWGAEYVESDKQKRRLHIPTRAGEWLDSQSKKMKDCMAAFVKGMNDYVEANPDEFSDDMKRVLPVRETDPMANVQVVYHLGVAGFALNPQAQQWKNAGSNAWAIAPSKSESGKAMLLMQPHPPWVFDSYLFFESHVVTPDNNRYGISALGAPVMAMGFNESLGWGLTFNQADAMDLYDLETSEKGYLYEGNWEAFEEHTEVIKIKDGDGFTEESLVVKKSRHGWVVEEKPGKALALRLGGLDKPFFVQQFLDMSHSKNLKEFEAAVSKIQLPLQNIVYADKHGEIFYLYNGEIPRRNDENYGKWNQVQDGSKASSMVESYLSYEELPKFKNPASGFISNTNNPPWSSTHPPVLKPEQFPGYIAPDFMDFRTQRALRMMTEEEKISFEELSQMLFSSHSELADLTLPTLIDFARKSTDPDVLASADVLANWDRAFNPESKGAVLFTNWVLSFRGRRFTSSLKLFADMAVSEEAKRYFIETVKRVKSRYGSLDIAWGEVEKLAFGGSMAPSSVGLNETGSFLAGQYRPMNDKAYVLIVGPSFSTVVEFGEKVQARGLLSYGNASQEKYSNAVRQLNMLSEKKLRKILFYTEDVKRATVQTEALNR
ncbi:MAG: acylase [Roseivirga sp.]|nr:acylase [Roseivirga sp.]